MRMRVLATALAAALPLAMLATPASADASTTFTFSGTNSQTLVFGDTGLVYADGCSHGFGAINENDPVTCFPDDFPGTLWARAVAGVNTTVLTTQQAAFMLDTPDTVRQDASGTVYTKLDATDGSGKEVVVKTEPWIQLDVAYDSFPANCPKNTITTVGELDAADTSGCLNVVLHTPQLSFGQFQVLAQDGILPYSAPHVFSQSADTPGLEILPGILNVHLHFATNATLTPGPGYNATRTIGSAGAPALVSGPIGWPDNTQQADTYTVPCGAAPGSMLTYGLQNLGWDGSGTVTTTPSVVFELLGFLDLSVPLATGTLFDSAVNASAADFGNDIGEVQAELTPPVISAAGATGGTHNEGSPVGFSATATDNCGTPTLSWQFSDGGTAFGPTPQHTFIDDGVYSGVVVATDAAGNTAQKSFSVTVNNVAPVVSGGPDKSSQWGLPVSFHANGTDAGLADRPWLLYSWAFNDPPTGGAAGPDVAHTFMTPGAYPVQVCLTDPQNASGCDTVDVTITKRGTTLGYTGAQIGTATDSVQLGANLRDSQGAAVQGRTVTFTVGSFSVSAVTNSVGDASATWPSAVVGSSPVSVSFGGDSLYEGSSASHAMSISKEVTSVSITSVKNGSPSKTVPVTVRLTDDDGTPIAGMTLTVALGSQGCTTGVTDASGIATCTVPKLIQKPGNYPFSATYAGNGTYIGATTLTTFTINKR